jgi:hypothetical protein
MTCDTPSTTPSSFIPSKSQAQSLQLTGYGIDDSRLRTNLFKLIYIWLRYGTEFWAWLTFIGGGHTLGWYWNNSKWLNFEIDLRKIESFYIPIA